MDEDRCEDCWWYWSGVNGYDCHRPIECYDIDPDDEVIDIGPYEEQKQEACGWFEPKEKSHRPDKWERYQKEWN